MSQVTITNSAPVINQTYYLFQIIIRALRSLGLIMIFLCGCIFPLVALAVEYFWGPCNAIFFDPIPSYFHQCLILLVPCAYLVAGRFGDSERLHTRTFSQLLLGFGVGISAFYTILFLPLLPMAGYFAVVSVFMLFIPALLLIPFLSPVASLCALIIQLRRLMRQSPGDLKFSYRPFLMGSACSVLLLLLAEVPRTLTALALSQVAQYPSDIGTLQRLRSYGDREVILRAAYGQGNSSANFLDWLSIGFSSQSPAWIWRSHNVGRFHSRGVPASAAQQIYYQITGIPYSKVPLSSFHRLPTSTWSGFRFDNFQGQQKIGSQVPGLGLSNSSIDASLDAQAAIAYSEWTLQFVNQSEFEQEARAEIQLPPDSVVSRATLWINGQEHEAVFGEKSKAIGAYQQVVARRRDPLLVTYQGPDRVLIQCFPIPRQGGEMKIRIGFTSALRFSSAQEVQYYPPYFSTTNFELSSDLNHQFWLESKSHLQGPNFLTSEQTPEHAYALRGAISEETMPLSKLMIRASRVPHDNQRWTVDTINKQVITQQFETITSPRFSNVILVIDGSQSLYSYADRLALAIEKLGQQPGAANFKIGALIAGDTLVSIRDKLAPNTLETVGAIAQAVRNYSYQGGADNVPALIRAWELSHEESDAAIIWIHGPQSHLFIGAEELKNRYHRRAGGPPIFSLLISAGEDKLSSILSDSIPIKMYYPAQLQSYDLDQIDGLPNGSKNWKAKRTAKVSKESEARPDSSRTSDHLVRLWAAEQVQQLLINSDSVSREQATRIATQYHLVTAVSAAVVLENQQQYQAAGLLNPSDKNESTQNNIPSVPEPEFALMMVIVMTVLVIELQRRKKASCV